ncbi:hypothetical protein DPV78_010287 [Talaromyces pinophilus]|nr:hypothetical protein DPV78_010287 [Talaromyces pinophilus]
MLARRDQENLVHTHQMTAASKPLNQGVRQLQPKTPGNRAPKTPFKVPLHDENEPLAFGKNTVKGNGGGLGGKVLQSGKEAFVTPLGPRNRAPLGAKTTNAKAAFKTPGLPADSLKTQKTKHIGSSIKKPKKAEIEVHQAQPQVVDASDVDDVPDVEYAPPKPKELPDDPEDITYDTTFPQFKGANMTRGWHKIYYHGDIGEDGLTDRQRKFQEQVIASEKKIDEMIQKQVDDIDLKELLLEDKPEPLLEASSSQAHKKEHTRSASAMLPTRASTLKARNAAAALSRPGSSATVRSDTVRSSSAAAKTRKTPTPQPNVSNARHAVATASSRTTVGYSRGRSVSSAFPNKPTTAGKKPSQPKAIVSPETYVQLYGAPPVGSEMWARCEEAGCLPEQEVVPISDEEIGLPLFEEDEETLNFQLTL